ncbi:MAG: hypothetical protein KME38_16755 [Spirirestis rafaelensis WJT71-NPBG6]|jgi:hypothetical protein|nr:hypothetical protein [Spirirestis rafaelensis WJT71-NPBG6]
MQIIKPTLGIETSLLGAVNSLGIPNRLSLKKESYFSLRSPLINYSKLFLRRQHKSLINLDTWNTENRHDDEDFDIFTNIVPIDFTEVDATAKQTYIDNTDIGINPIVNNIFIKPIEKHKNINNSSQLNQHKKSKSKKTTKSKPKAKSKKQDQSLNQNNTIVPIDDRQLEISSFNIAETELDTIRLTESPLPAKHITDLPENPLVPSIPTSSQIQDKPIFLEELANNQLITSEQIKNSVQSENLEEINFFNTPENSTPLHQSIDSKIITNKSQETKSSISTNLPQNSENSTLLRDTNDEQLKLEPLVMPLTEITPESLISNIPINSTPQPQNTNLDITKNQLQKLPSEALKTNLAKAEQPILLKHLPNDKQQVTPKVIPEPSFINPTLEPQDIELDNITEQTNLPIIQTPTEELVQQKRIVEDSLNVSQYISFSDVDASKIPPTPLSYIPPLKREFMGDKTLSDKYWDVPYSPIPDKETKEQSKLHTSNQPEKLYNQENSTDSLLKSENSPIQESFPELSFPSQNVTLESQESIPVLPAVTVDNTKDKSTLLRTITSEQQTLSTTSSLEISEEVDVSEISKSPTSPKQNTNVDNTTLKLQESLISNFSNIEEKPTASKELENEKQIITSEIAVVHPQILEKLHVLDIPEDTQASHSKDISNLPDSQHNQDNTLPIEALENKPFEIPAPAGFATGGLVAASQPIEKQQIASSDIIPAMLTPGEFIINARDAQQNLDVLHYLNSGGTLPEDVIFPTAPTLESKEEADTASIKPSTKVDTFKQTAPQENVDLNLSTTRNLLTSPSPDLGIKNQGIAIDSSLQFNTFANSKSDVSKSNDYLSPPQIFRQKNTNNTNAPSQWSSVEELLNGNNEFTIFNFGDVEYSRQNLENSSMDESPKIFAKQLPSPKGFAEGGEVTVTDIATNIEPITETIQRPSDLEDKNYPDLETLAREVYHRLRQRLEIERERHGIYLGRLPW